MTTHNDYVGRKPVPSIKARLEALEELLDGSASYVRYEDGDLVAPDDSVIPFGTDEVEALIAGTQGTARKAGGVWPTRPTGYESVCWKGASPGPTIGGAGNAIDGLDEWDDLT